MDDLRYAVGGSPIAHSLSPILFNLVLKDLQNKGHFSKLDVSSITVIDANHIDEVLGWAYIEHDKHQPIWSPANHKLKPFQIRLSHLVEEALEIEPLAGFGPVLETPKRSTRSNTLPARSSSREVWLNLTSPLKHQLQSMVFSPVDDAFDILSVNSLRYSGQGWYCASTDGHGIVNVAYHVGIDVSKGAVLGIHGGGGAARSIASAWSGAGGTVVSLGGRRQLPADLVTGTFIQRWHDLRFDNRRGRIDDECSSNNVFTQSNLRSSGRRSRTIERGRFTNEHNHRREVDARRSTS